MLLLEPLSFITSYWLLRFLYFCFIVKKVAIRKRLKFYDHSLSIAVYDTIVISDKKGKFIYQRNIPLKHSMPQMIRYAHLYRNSYIEWRKNNSRSSSEIYDILRYMQHQHARGRDATTGSLHRTLSIHTTAIEQTYMAEECDENDYHFDLDSYKPVQPITIDHGVALFPVAAPHTGMDLHLLQVNMQFIRSRYRCRVICLPPLLPPFFPFCPPCVHRVIRMIKSVAIIKCDH